MMGLGLACSIALAVVGLLNPVAAEAQQGAKVARIGYLGGSSADTFTREAFLQGLREFGRVEGRNLVIEFRYAEGNLDRYPALAAELVALNVDVIVATGTPAALAAKDATRTIPIVFGSAPDPVESGLVTNLARPGGNVTGTSNLTPELAGKWVELLKQAVPGVRRLAVLWQPGAVGKRTEEDMRRRMEVAGRALAVQLQFFETRGPADLDAAFLEMSRARVSALAVLPGPCSSASGDASWTSRQGTVSRRCTHGASSSMRGDSWPTDRTFRI